MDLEVVVTDECNTDMQEKLNEGLAKETRWPVDMRALDDPHVKTNLLLQVVAESRPRLSKCSSQDGVYKYFIFNFWLLLFVPTVADNCADFVSRPISQGLTYLLATTSRILSQF